MQRISIVEPALFQPGLQERYALEIEGQMTDTEKRILDGLTSIETKLNGTNGDPGIMTRLRLLEERSSDRAVLMRQVKAGFITALIGAVIAFAAARLMNPTTPVYDNQQRIEKLEAELGKAQDALEKAQKELQTVREPAPVPRHTTRPRRPPNPPLLNRLRDGDLITTQDMPIPTFGYNRSHLLPMERPK